MQIGIVGLPNAGKSTLFNALVQRYQAKVAPYAFTTIDPNVGVVEVPGERLDRIAETLKLPKKIPSTIEFVDIAGLVKGAHTGEGLGNQFLSHIRGVDAIVHIVRGFADPTSKEVADPASDYQTIRDELVAADQGKTIEEGQRLATKPELVILNVAEGNLKRPIPSGLPNKTMSVSAKLESELVEFPPAEREAYLKELQLSESLLPRLIRAAYDSLDLITFYSLLPDQVQAWPIKKGMKAPEAAGTIHTDFAKHFVAAEVVDVETLIAARSWHAAKEQGKVRTEGKTYLLKDGDVIHFRTGA